MCLIKYAGKCGFDNDGSTLDAMEIILQKAQPSNRVLLETICDATCQICVFMGRPLFIEQGKVMLSKLLYPQYHIKTREYTRQALDTIVKIKL